MESIPVYLITGMLEAGKTNFARGAFDNIPPDTNILLLVCEQGEEIYTEPLPPGVDIIEVEDLDELTPEAYRKLEEAYQPDMVFVELNGMWPILDFCETMPESWGIFQSICLVDAATFEMYLKNMPEQVLEKLRLADVIIFNRCTPELAEVLHGMNLRIINRRAGIFLQFEDGQMEDYLQSDSDAFDMSQPVIEIPDEDFGVFFVEIMEQTDKYVGKKVRFTGLVDKGREYGKYFSIGRVVMTCCEQDMNYCALAFRPGFPQNLDKGSWVEVTATVKKGYWSLYEGQGPILSITSVREVDEPEHAIVSI